MSLFGRLDAANVSSNPYFVEAGIYPTEITKAEFKTNKDGGRNLMFEFQITDEDSLFKNKRVQKYFSLVDPNMTEADLALLPIDEQRNIQRANAALKSTLCGSGKRKGLGVNPEDLNDPEWDPKTLVGLTPDVSITNYGPDNQGVNVQWINIPD